MIVPKNGRVVIIDDKFEEITGLISVLSKAGISFTYFNGGVESLPDVPLTDTSIVFLDLELDGSVPNNDVTQASQVINVLSNILGASASDCSIVIIVWSGALSILENLKPRMPGANIRPLALIEIEKSDCKVDGVFSLDLIKRSIEAKLNELPALNLLFSWDDLVGKAANDVYKKIMPTGPLDAATLNSRLNSIYRDLAKACIGDSVTENDSYATLNLLNTVLANEIGKYEATDIQLNITNVSPINLEDQGKINYSINMTNIGEDLLPGCVIRPIPASPIIDVNDLFQDATAKQRAQDAVSNLFEEKMIPVLCEVTPLCDVAQKRACLYRLLPGMIVPAAIYKWINKPDYYYITPKFFIKDFFNNEVFYVVYDFRRLFTVELTAMTEPVKLFRFGETLLMYIQNRLGRQVSNPGITYLQ